MRNGPVMRRLPPDLAWTAHVDKVRSRLLAGVVMVLSDDVPLEDIAAVVEVGPDGEGEVFVGRRGRIASFVLSRWRCRHRAVAEALAARSGAGMFWCVVHVVDDARVLALTMHPDPVMGTGGADSCNNNGESQ